MLIPLYWFLLLIGSFLNFSPSEIEGKQVYLAPYVEMLGDTPVVGTACVAGPVTNIYSRLCTRADVPQNTIILYPWGWRMDENTQRHVVVHEMEHLLRARGDRPGDTRDEEAVGAVACGVVWSPYFC